MIMAVLSVFLLFLKIIGMILLSLLALIVFILLLVLFVPFKYFVDVDTIDEPGVYVKASWLYNLLGVKYINEKGKQTIKPRVLLFSISRGEKKKKPEERKAEKKKRENRKEKKKTKNKTKAKETKVSLFSRIKKEYENYFDLRTIQ